MADFRALTIQSGLHKQQQDADNLIVGAGIKTSTGNLTITAAGGTISLASALSFAAGIGLSVTAGSSAFDFSAGTGIFKTSTGAFTIGPASAASAISTATGALTITSAAGATWSTSAGILTLNGTAGITLQGGAVSALAVNAAGTAITVQTGATLNTTGTGMINLPSSFQINGSGVSANVTATNLNTLTAGSSSVADSLHTHNFTVSASGLTTTNMTTSGTWGYVSANNTISKTDNAAIGTSRAIGVYEGTSGTMVLQGIISDAAFTTAGGTPTVGTYAYLAALADDTNTGAGKLTATVPSSGVVAPVALVLDTTNYATLKTCKVAIQIQSPTQL